MAIGSGALSRIAVIAGAFALDTVLGDPPSWPHPVRLVGKQIEFEEGLVRDFLLTEADAGGWLLDRERTEKLAGAALAADVALVSPLAVAGALKMPRKVHPAVSFAAETFLCYQLLATRSLADAAHSVYEPLAQGDVEEARSQVALIVGRDTDRLDAEGVARATVETVAENASDGVVAPLLFMGVGGAIGGMFYKAVNTLDSMVGYKNDAYRNLGYAGAKLDDLVNFVPARVTGVLMCAAAALTGEDAQGAWRVFLRDRLKHSSPNSAHSEAACAGALGVRLGGPNKYFGQVVEKPYIGEDGRAVEASDIPRSVNLMRCTAVLALGAAAVLSLTFKGRSR